MGWFIAYYVPTTWAAAEPDVIRRSAYLSMLEGRKGHIRTKPEHAAYLADKAAKEEAAREQAAIDLAAKLAGN
jgi:hypothetical protein